MESALLDPQAQIAAQILSETFNPVVARTSDDRTEQTQVAPGLAEHVVRRSTEVSLIKPIQLKAQSTDDWHTPTTEES